MIGSDPLAALFFQTVSMMTLVVLSMTFLRAQLRNHTWYCVAMGMVLGISATIGMFAPMNMHNGAILDARSLMIGMGGAYFGFWGAAISTTMAVIARIAQGDPGMLASLSAIVIAGGMGFIWGRNLSSAAQSSLLGRLALGAMLCASMVGPLIFIPAEWRWDFLALLGVPLCVMNMAGSLLFCILISRENARYAATEMLSKAADTDPLTGVLNRRAFVAHHEKSGATAAPQALLYLDLDHFKAINDTHGHHIGDQVLMTFATLLETSAPEDAVVARTGGEEFAISWSGCSAAQADALGHQLVDIVAQSSLCAALPDLVCTVSVGVAHLPTGGSFERLLEPADKRLYAAKAAGRNRCCGTDQPIAGTNSPRPSRPHPDASGQKRPG